MCCQDWDYLTGIGFSMIIMFFLKWVEKLANIVTKTDLFSKYWKINFMFTYLSTYVIISCSYLILLVALAPRDYKIVVRGHDAQVTWNPPHLFGKSCTYKVLAKPAKGKGNYGSELVGTNKYKVDFRDLSPSTEYNFILATICGSEKEILTNLGTKKTGPRGNFKTSLLCFTQCGVLLIVTFQFLSSWKNSKSANFGGRTLSSQVILESSRCYGRWYPSLQIFLSSSQWKILPQWFC